MIKKPKYSRDFENPNLFLQKKAAQESRQSSFLCFFFFLLISDLTAYKSNNCVTR